MPSDKNCAVYLLFEELSDNRQDLEASIEASKSGITVRVLGRIVNYSSSRDLLELTNPEIDPASTDRYSPAVVLHVDTGFLDQSQLSGLVSGLLSTNHTTNTGTGGAIVNRFPSAGNRLVLVIGELVCPVKTSSSGWLIKAQSLTDMSGVDLRLYRRAALLTRKMISPSATVLRLPSDKT